MSLFKMDFVFYDSGGSGRSEGHPGEEGTITGKECPEGLYGTFCEVGFCVFLLVCLKFFCFILHYTEATFF